MKVKKIIKLTFKIKYVLNIKQNKNCVNMLLKTIKLPKSANMHFAQKTANMRKYAIKIFVFQSFMT